MSSEANAASTRRIAEEAIGEGRLEVFDELCSPDVVSHDPAEAEDVHGIDAHKERVRQYRAAMSDLEVMFDDVIAVGDKVVSRWSVCGTHDGDLQGIPATGRRIVITGISIDRYDENGKLAETWDQWDNAGFAVQLGLSPAAATQSA